MKHIVVIGSLNIDLVSSVERLPRRGETLIGGDLGVFEGGKGANQACAAGRLGGTVTMIGQVGDDPFATRLKQTLQAAGVDTSGIGLSERPTGSACISVLPDGENAIIVSPGANATLSPEIALERLRAVAPYGFVLGQLETPMTTIVAVFAEARRSGATTILDPAPIQPLPTELIPHLDFITPNQIEAAALLGRPKDCIRNLDDASAAADSLLSAGYRGIVVKLGQLGCYVATEHLRAAVPAFEVVSVDTTAAGDTFNGAFAVALAESVPIEQAAMFANAAAALSVTRHGAQDSIPARAEVESMLTTRSAIACSR